MAGVRFILARADPDAVALLQTVDLRKLLWLDDVARACPHGPQLQLAADYVPDPFGRDFPLVLVSVSIHQVRASSFRHRLRKVIGAPAENRIAASLRRKQLTR